MEGIQKVRTSCMIIIMVLTSDMNRLNTACKSLYTVVWEIFACNNFRMLKVRMGKFSYNNGCSKFERAKRDFRLKFFWYVILERSRAYMHAMEEFHRSPSRPRCLQQ